MKQIKRFLWPTLGIIGVVTIIVFILDNNTQSAAKEIKADQEPVSFTVTATPARKVSTELGATIRGEVEAKNIFTLYSEADGKVNQSSIDLGKTVKAGQNLVSIEASSRTSNLKIIEQNLKKARLDFDVAQKQFNRYKALLEKGNTSTIEFENTKSQLETTEIQLRTTEQELELARIQVKQTKVLAPASGVIIDKKINIGDYVQTGTPLGTLAEDKLIIKCFVPEKIALQSQTNQTVVIIADGSPGKKLKGVIKTIVPHPNEAKLYPIEIEIGNKSKLIAGMGVTILFSSSENTPSLLIPRTALTGDFNNPTVYTINSKKQPVKRKIVIGKTIGEQVEVLDGLSENELVILSGQSNIEPGKILANYKLVQ